MTWPQCQVEPNCFLNGHFFFFEREKEGEKERERERGGGRKKKIMKRNRKIINYDGIITLFEMGKDSSPVTKNESSYEQKQKQK